MSKTIYSTISILLLTLFLSAFVFAQDKSCTIEGTLTDADGKPAKNALVTINDNIKKRTNDKGYFSVSTVCGGIGIKVSEIKGIPTKWASIPLNSGQKLSISVKKLKDYYWIVDSNNVPLINPANQDHICGIFLDEGFNSMKKKLQDIYSTTLEDSYNQIRCEGRRTDLLKNRVIRPTAKLDLISFILYYKNDLKREEDLPAIFNINVPGPEWPSGTLLDFIEAYQENVDLSEGSKKEYANMIKFLRKYGAKNASEL